MSRRRRIPPVVTIQTLISRCDKDEARNTMPPPAGLYGNYRFTVIWSGRSVAGFEEVSPLPQRLLSADRLESGFPPPALGPEGQRTPYFINLDRGISLDPGFGQWISMVRCYGPSTGKGSLLVEYKRPLTIQVNDATGEEYAYHLTHCWVTEYKAIPDPDPDSRKIAIEHLRLGFDGWERDPPEDE